MTVNSSSQLIQLLDYWFGIDQAGRCRGSTTTVEHIRHQASDIEE
ncbi:hypothetical protein [Streptomyces sp. NPDC093093]